MGGGTCKRAKKPSKISKKGIDKGWVIWYSSKAVRKRTAGAGRQKKVDYFAKNKLTRWKACANIMTVPQMGRVPCKLNNERNEKHQTGAQKCATRSLREVPGSVNYRDKRKDKKF